MTDSTLHLSSIGFSRSSLLKSVRSSFTVSSEKKMLRTEKRDEAHRVRDRLAVRVVRVDDDAEGDHAHRRRRR